MKKNLDAAAKRKEKILQKEKKQSKAMKIVGIVTLVLVVIFCIGWGIYGIRNGLTRDLSGKEVQAMFENEEVNLKEDNPLVGTWYFFQNNAPRTKYIITVNGKMLVYAYEDSKAIPQSTGDFRLRKHTNEMYVHPQGDSKFICYTYDIFTDDNLYYMDLSCAGQTWRLVKLLEEPKQDA